MKRFLSYILVVLCMGSIFISCTNPTTPTNADNSNNNATDENNKNVIKEELLPQKKALYKELSGTKWLLDYDHGTPKVIIFSDDSISFDNVQYSINFNTNVFLPEEVSSYIKQLNCPIYFYLGKNYYGFEDWSSNYPLLRYYTSQEEQKLILYKKDTSYNPNSPNNNNGNSGSLNESSVAGSYSYTKATGIETNGKITLSNGNWSYSGSKVNMAATSGSYVLNGSKITFKWTRKGINFEDTFTVSDLGNGSVKWVCDDSTNSTFLNMVFGMVNTSVVLEKSN